MRDWCEWRDKKKRVWFGQGRCPEMCTTKETDFRRKGPIDVPGRIREKGPKTSLRMVSTKRDLLVCWV